VSFGTFLNVISYSKPTKANSSLGAIGGQPGKPKLLFLLKYGTHRGEAVNKPFDSHRPLRTSYYFQNPLEALTALLSQSKLERIPPRTLQGAGRKHQQHTGRTQPPRRGRVIGV